MKMLRKIGAVVNPLLGRILCVLAVAFGFMAVSGTALATDDAITTTVTSLSGYWTTIQTLAIGIVLFLIGRRLLRKV